MSKETSQNGSWAPKLLKYVRSRFWKNKIFTIFWVNLFFGHPKNFGNFDLVGPLLRVPGGGYPQVGVKNYRRGLLYHFPALDFLFLDLASRFVTRSIRPTASDQKGIPLLLEGGANYLLHK